MTWPGVVAALLFLACGYLFVRQRRLVRELGRVRRTTEEIRTGNLNLRYRLPAPRRLVEELSGELNRLIDYFQQTTERMLVLEDERKRMIASLSHDLRTPLTSLLGYIEALRNDASLTAEERSEFLCIAADKGNSLLERLQSFFELARLEADDAPPDLRPMNLTDTVQEVLLGFYPDFQKAGIEPSVRLPASPLYVMADGGGVRRILENLLSNALRYGKDGGEIGVAVREEEDFAAVDVWDRGRGIPPADLPRVFERFYTGEDSRNASLRGTGLGLAIARNLVEKQGGRISVSSRPGEKTVFSFSLHKD
ncbi:sensor histidine kinase [Cohnella hashimotonis]|uniref:histidine kinase n=1 Tax=Cohnella hashimotonis TaxID=2826895 RepID=A0ABT6TLX8_9BACL|nr:HAMP domain-containing sensor histidine kinase [Cohnella hashimotonis]MDI4647735.1 HAMP domain-containing sensor histidine kinase [Cohnella hashimotonis]